MFEHMRKLREERGLSEKQVADYLQVSETAYSDYEQGKRRIPLQALARLAYFFGTSIDYLVGITDEIKPHPRKKCE
ncbi:helix-turn-helix transcriptional regulator [Ligaoa zhengdingensis]|uniref:helix-turn-helix domain-containing protein n=1 Tax=Ligaoa zhengdingensis TaxID=2763658 RepID=UPI0031BA0A67